MCACVRACVRVCVCVCVCVPTPKTMNYIHVILNIYVHTCNKLSYISKCNKTIQLTGVAIVTKNFVMESNPIDYAITVKVVSFTERVVLMAVHE